MSVFCFPKFLKQFMGFHLVYIPSLQVNLPAHKALYDTKFLIIMTAIHIFNVIFYLVLYL